MPDETNLPGDVLDVLIIGAGFSGICCAIKLLEKGQTNFRLVEKSTGIGGTWWDNTYPGAACDVPSHFYCFSFEPNPDWSRVYSPQPEIQRYIEHCADKYGVRPHMQFGRKVRELRLDERSGVWRVDFEDGSELQARHVINGGGGLHEPSWPDIPGMQDFVGPTMHSARWNHEIDYAGKNVAVIGSAASAIQLIPQLAKTASRVDVYHRTANYIVPRNDRDFSATEKARFARWPWLGRLYRQLVFLRLDIVLFPITRAKSRYAQYVTGKVNKHMRNVVADESLHPHLEPDYRLGCKRILVSDDIFQTYNQDNVNVITESIKSVEKSGLRTVDGRFHNADILVYATGYDIEAHMRSISVVGSGGRSLSECWHDVPEAYNGCCIAGFPNYYMVTGPNTGVGTTSVVFMIEQSVRYILELIDKAGGDGMISVRHEPLAAYNETLHAQLEQTVWASGCKSWYRREDGKIIILYPNNARAFREQLKRVNMADFEIRRLGE